MACFLSLFLFTAFLISPIYAQTCTSQSFAGNSTVRYTNCTDLPSLNAFLHWSYDQTNATLSVAYIAPPANPGGWVAWAINPIGTGMAGAEALLALRESNGSTVVKTYRISNYSSIVESNLLYDVLDRRGEFSNGTMKIFATLALPENMTSFNMIWQVGPSVTNGVPDVHAFQRSNLNAKSSLRLLATAGDGGSAGSPSPSSSPPPTAGGGGGGGGGSGGRSHGEKLLNNGVFGLSVLLGSIFVFVF